MEKQIVNQEKITPTPGTEQEQEVIKNFDYAYFTSTAKKNLAKSNLYSFMVDTFGQDLVTEVTDSYLRCGDVMRPIGTNELFWVDTRREIDLAKLQKYDTFFWYLDKDGEPLNAKIMAYNASNGKRDKNILPNWYHSIVGKKSPDLGFFGEHLTAPNIWIVESEKTALFCKAFILDTGIKKTEVWATGGRENLKKAFANTTQYLYDKKFILMPNSDTENEGFRVWEQLGYEIAETYKIEVVINTYLLEELTPEQKAQNFDMADVVSLYY